MQQCILGKQVNAPSKKLTPTVEDALNECDSTPHVYQAICEVQGELAKTGIAKNRVNSQGSGYNFRGIDDVYAALSPLLSRHRLIVVPRMIDRQLDVRQSAQGKPLFAVTVHAEFDFISAIDGTTHTAATFGEAMDSGDKATNKAMSAAYKYAAFMTFAIPTEGDNDADGTTHELVAPKSETADAIKVAEIERLCPLAGKTVQDICEAYNVSSLAELTHSKAAAAIKRLNELAKEPA